MDKKQEKMVVDGLGSSGTREINVEYPCNSHKYKAAKISEKKQPQRATKKVVNGNVIVRKKSLGKKMSETLFGDNFRKAKDYIVHEVLIPAAKNTISDMINGGVETVLFGESRGRSSKKNKTYTSYTSYYTDRPKRELSYQSRSRHSIDDIVFETRSEAEDVLSTLVGFIEDYGAATIEDLYDSIGVTANFTDTKYGWDNLSEARISRVRDGYLLNLPRPILLD